ncbi:hypothetical protein H206_05363 [Candidatus Electrothrix aarhusensis]|uniref:Uncharacterized protein n=1 Tax=Candidatus Electrothrix aarhusensis TaxID=1859131 RepID=A0A444J4W9_9BACT|nr:hypothetical protein H206_05363 [Candidatus Electrothrix aarhusensis]
MTRQHRNHRQSLHSSSTSPPNNSCRAVPTR